MRRRYDLVGFDPRGVGRSMPIDCVGDSELDTFIGGVDATPDTPAEEQGLLAEAKKFADGCAAKNPKIIAHVSTVDTARDMDVLRAALGEPKLNYLGASYGTFLGATYAGLFPSQMGRFVLDGPVPPDLTAQEMATGQAKGFEIATQAYVDDCVRARLPGRPEPRRGDGLDPGLPQGPGRPAAAGHQRPDGHAPLTEGWARLGILYACTTSRSGPS